MPCNDGYPTPAQEAESQRRRRLEERLDAATAAACAAFTALERLATEHNVKYPTTMVGKVHAKWWRDHQEMDRQRILKEKKEEAQKKLRAGIRKKLKIAFNSMQPEESKLAKKLFRRMGYNLLKDEE